MRKGAARTDEAAATVLGRLQKPVAMTPQQQQQQQAAQYTLRHTLTFTPAPQLPASSSSSYYASHPSPHLSTVTESSVSPAAAHFHTTVSFPNHGPHELTNSHSAFAPPFVPTQPASHSTTFPSRSHAHPPFVLRPAPPSTFPPAPPLPAGGSAPHSQSQPATDLLFHAALARFNGVEPPPPYPQGFSSLSSTAFSGQSYPYPPSSYPALPSLQSLSPFPPRSVRASVWHCPLGCGQTYKKSSGRSIRRHFVACFRQHNQSSASSLSDTQLSSLIAERQDTGQLTTGLRRWKMRSARRRVEQLRDEERWECVWGCGKRYRSTSTRSIQRHIAECDRRPGGGGSGGRDQQPRKATTGTDNDSGDRESEDEEEEDDENEGEEAEQEELRDSDQRPESYQSTPVQPRVAAVEQRISPPTDTIPPTSSPGAPHTSFHGSSYNASYPSAMLAASESTLRLLSSAATNSLAPHNIRNNLPLFYPNAQPSSATASSAGLTLHPLAPAMINMPLSNNQLQLVSNVMHGDTHHLSARHSIPHHPLMTPVPSPPLPSPPRDVSSQLTSSERPDAAGKQSATN